MTSFFRLLENSGLGYFEFLLENMSRSQAVQVFDFHGVSSAGQLDPESLKSAWRNLLKQFHDPGNPEGYTQPEAVKEINAAYDVLKNGGAQGRSKYSATGTPYEPSQPENEYNARWAWAGHSGGIPPNSRISRQDYRDVNFIKKRMWELSGHSKQEWTIWAWDGHYFRNSTTVYGSPEIFHEMAEAMVVWNGQGGNPYDTVAVLASKGKSRVLHVLYYNGEFLDTAPELPEHESFNLNPSNDQGFVNRLNRELQRIFIRSQTQVSEAVLMEISTRTPTTVVYRFDKEGGWRPLGVLNRDEDLNDFLRREAGFILSSLQQAALDSGEVVMNIAIRTFDAILPSPGW